MSHTRSLPRTPTLPTWWSIWISYLHRATAGGGSDLSCARSGFVEFPERPQCNDLAVVVDAVGEHALGLDLVAGGSDLDVADVGFLVAALVGLLEVEGQVAGGDRHVIELGDRFLAAVACAFGVEMRRSDRILDDGVIGEVGEPRVLVVRDCRLARTLTRQVDRCVRIGDRHGSVLPARVNVGL